MPYELPQTPIAPGEGQPVRRLGRPVQGRMAAGVCAGLAEHLGLNVRHVRLAFVLASLVGGAGVAAYLLLWALTPQSRAATPVPATRTVTPGRELNESLRNLVVGLGLLVVGGALFAEQHRVDLRLGVLIPLLTVAGGAVLAWSQLDDAERGRWLVGGGEGRRAGLVRLGIGIALASIGVVFLDPGARPRGRVGCGDPGRGGSCRRRPDRGSMGRASLERPAGSNRHSASVRPSGPTSPRICTTRSCRPWL